MKKNNRHTNGISLLALVFFILLPLAVQPAPKDYLANINGAMSSTCTVATATQYFNDGVNSGCHGTDLILPWKAYLSSTNTPAEIVILDIGDQYNQGPNVWFYLSGTTIGNQLMITLNTYDAGQYKSIELRNTLTEDLYIGTYILQYEQRTYRSKGNTALLTPSTIFSNSPYYTCDLLLKTATTQVLINSFTTTNSNRNDGIKSTRSGFSSYINFQVTQRLPTPTLIIRSTSTNNVRFRPGVRLAKLYITACPTVGLQAYILKNFDNDAGAEVCIHPANQDIYPNCRYYSLASRNEIQPGKFYYVCNGCPTISGNAYKTVYMSAGVMGCNRIDYPNVEYHLVTTQVDVSGQFMLVPSTCAAGYYTPAGNLKVTNGATTSVTTTGKVCLSSTTDAGVVNVLTWTFNTGTRVYQIDTCATGYSKTTLVSGKTRCIPADIKTLGYRCADFKEDAGNANGYSCNSCSSASYKMVILDTTGLTLSLPLTGPIKACTVDYFPGAITDTARYIPTTVTDASGYYIYVPKVCDSILSPAVAKLFISTGAPLIGTACVAQNAYVKQWQVNAAKTGYVIRTCETAASQSTLQVAPNDKICVPDEIFDISYNCKYFIADSNQYGFICDKCNTGVLQTIHQKVKIQNTLGFDVFGCTSQKLNSNVALYKKPTQTAIKDLDNYFILTAATCTGGAASAGVLVLKQRKAPGTATDQSGITCTTTDNWVSKWEWDYTNKIYQPNTCTGDATSKTRWTTPAPPTAAASYCIPTQLVTLSKGCTGWTRFDLKYYKWQCGACPALITTHLIDLDPAQLSDQSAPTSNLKACTSILLPNVQYYKTTALIDSAGRTIYTAQKCTGVITSVGTLYLQTVALGVVTGTDQSGLTCRSTSDPLVSSWTVDDPVTTTKYIPFTCYQAHTVIDGLGNVVCVPVNIITDSYNCVDYKYDATEGIICKTCPSSPTNYLKVKIDSLINGGNIYGCAVATIPQVQTYQNTGKLDINGKKLLTQSTCVIANTFQSTQRLRIVSGSTVDTTGFACLPQNIPQDTYVQTWQVNTASPPDGFELYDCKTASSSKLLVYNGVNPTVYRCVPNDVTLNSPNCVDYQIISTVTNVLGYQCKNCPTNSDGVAFTLVTMYNTAVVGTLKGCSYFNIPFTSTYSITSSLVDADGNKILTTRQCSGGRTAASTATLKLTVDSSSDASGVACPSSDLPNVLNWRINAANTDIQPNQCTGGVFFPISNGAQTQQCVPNDVVAASPGCSGFQVVAGPYYRCDTCPGTGLGAHTPVDMAPITSGGVSITVKGCQLTSLLIPGAGYYVKTTILDDLSPSAIPLLTSSTCNPVIASGAPLGSLRLTLSVSVFDTTGIACIVNDPTVSHWTVQAGAYKIYDCVVGGVIRYDNGQQGCLNDVNAYDADCTYSFSTKLCTTCDSGTLKKNVELDKIGVPTIYAHCLSSATQVLPGCNLYTRDSTIYYCKTGNCLFPTVQIPIGAAANQLGCTAFSLFGTQYFGDCVYYVRPRTADTQLKCAVCNNNLASTPYCRMAVTTCPTGYSAAYVYGQIGWRCGLFGLTQFCEYYTSFDQATATFGPCKSCYLSFTIAQDLFGNNVCVQGSIKDCINYNVDGSCKTCKVGLFDVANGVCPSAAQKLIQNCQNATIVSGAPRCSACNPGFVLISQGLTARACFQQIQNCSTYSRSTGQCLRCVEPDFYLSSNGQCVKVNSDDKCATYNFRTNTCDQCKQGYTQNSTGQCILVVNCPVGQYKNISGVCTVGTRPNCEQFIAPFGQCLKCAKNYKFEGLDCVEIPDNFKILDCPPSTAQITWYQQLGQCKSRQNPCGDLNNDGTCRWCISTDFYLTFAGKCQPVVNIINGLRQQSLRTQN